MLIWQKHTCTHLNMHTHYVTFCPISRREWSPRGGVFYLTAFQAAPRPTLISLPRGTWILICFSHDINLTWKRWTRLRWGEHHIQEEVMMMMTSVSLPHKQPVNGKLFHFSHFYKENLNLNNSWFHTFLMFHSARQKNLDLVLKLK